MRSSSSILPTGPALGVLELSSLARGGVVLDAIVKRSPVRIIEAARVSRGRFLIIINGGVAEVEEGFDAGRLAADDVLVDKLLLPQAHEQIHTGLIGSYHQGTIESLGLFETTTAASAIKSLDAALKETDVDLCGLQLCKGIAGKGHWIVTGLLHAVEAALEMAEKMVERETLVSADIVARPHEEAVVAYLAPFR